LPSYIIQPAKLMDDCPLTDYTHLREQDVPSIL
jgi:hypothetical protein